MRRQPLADRSVKVAVQESGMGVPEFLRVVKEEAEARSKEAKLQEKK